MNQRTTITAQEERDMKWYDSGPISILGCTLGLLLVYFIAEFLPSAMFFGVSLTFCAAATAYCITDLKRKFPDCNSKIGASILFAISALAYALAQIAL